MIRTPSFEFNQPTFIRAIPLRPINTDLRSQAERRMWKTQIEGVKRSLLFPVKRAVSKLFKEEGNVVVAAYGASGEHGVESAISAFRPRWHALLRTTWLQVGFKALKVVSKAYNNSVSESYIDLADPELGWDRYVTQYFRSESGLSKADGISDYSQLNIKAAIKQGMNEGETTGEIASRITDIYGKACLGRATTIARTEVNAATNYASLHTMQEYGGANQKTWMCMMDNSRQWHIDADGQTVAIADQFTVNDELIDCPGDGSPENSVNCNCDLEYSTAEEAPHEEKPAPVEEPAEEAPKAVEEIEMPQFNSIDDIRTWADTNLRGKLVNADETEKQINRLADEWPGSINPEASKQRNYDRISSALKYTREIELQTTHTNLPDIEFNMDKTRKINALAFYSGGENTIVYSIHTGEIDTKLIGQRYAAVADKIASDEIISSGVITPKGLVYHEYTHAIDPWTTPTEQAHSIAVDALSDNEKASLSKLSGYANAAINRMEIRGTVPNICEAYNEAAAALAEGSPTVKYIPKPIKESIYIEYPWLKSVKVYK